MSKEYDKLRTLSTEIATLNSVGALLMWDQETYMPPNGGAARGSQAALIASLVHQKNTARPYKAALSKLIDLDSGKIRGEKLSLRQKAALREWRRDYLHATKFPAKFVNAWSQATTDGVEAWRKAKEHNDFSLYAPALTRVIDLARERAEHLGYAKTPYDALIDEYEPGMTTAKVTTLFTDLSLSISKLRKKLLKAPAPENAFLFDKYPVDEQMEYGLKLIEAVGYNEDNTRVDLSDHPFCQSLHPSDCRMTTRVDENDPIQNFSALLHEAGHHLYEVNLPAEEFGTPLGQAASMGMHESQSRWWECMIGLSRPFWEYYLPSLKKAFPKQLNRITLDKFHQALLGISTTPIRIHSDEVSYPLHIIVRFELERDMIDGKLEVKDLPDAWNAAYKSKLDITPKNDAEGCMQDIHWSCGLIGYFPTYTLGNIYSAQLFLAFATEHKDWQERVANGEFAFIREWLYEKIHKHGRQYVPSKLIEQATSSPLTSKPYLAHLNERYR